MKSITMEAHPGPYMVDEGSHGHYVAIKSATTGKTVARVPWGKYDGGTAQLLAASHDMLEACQAALARVTVLEQELARSRGTAVADYCTSELRHVIAIATEC